MEDKPRTQTQNRALHLMFRQLSEQLNESGLDMKKTLKPDIDIWWNEKMVKEYIWRPLQRIITGKESSTEISTKDIDKIFEVISKNFGEKFGLEIRFPSIETLISEQRIREVKNESNKKIQS